MTAQDLIHQARALVRRNPVISALTVLTGLLHLGLAGRYDIFRNELYYIVCGRHPDFGYADQPPLVPLVAAASQVFGDNVWVLRVPVAIAATVLVPLTAALARRLGGTPMACGLAAAGAALSPALAGMTATTNTSSFEPLAWTLTAYLVTRGVVARDNRPLLWAGLAGGIGMEAKYGIAIWFLALAAGLLLTAARRVFLRRDLWAGIAIGAAIAAPSLIWQQLKGWPFLEVIRHHHDAGSILTGTPLEFALGQIMAMNPVLAPLWLAGVIVPFVSARLAPARFLSIAFVAATLIIYLTGGKDYYLFPVYPALIAVGAVAVSTLRAAFLWLWFGAAAVVAIILAPIAVPILDPPALAAYLAATHLRPPPDEVAAIGAPLTQVFSDELGWRDLERRVAAIYQALPAEEQRHATILTTNYGEAAAIDVYGAADHLPRAVTGQDQYYFWGPGDGDGSVIIHVNGDVERWKHLCQSLDIADTFGVPYAMPYENGRPILLCRGFRADLAATWFRFKRMQ